MWVGGCDDLSSLGNFVISKKHDYQELLRDFHISDNPKLHLETFQTSTIVIFCRNKQFFVVGQFCKKISLMDV